MSEVPTFEEFASSRARKLFQVAYLTCGDWHQAHDLVQTTLGNLFAVWPRLRRQGQVEHLDAYARKALLRTYLSHRRLRRSGELTVAQLPERVAEPVTASELRLTLVAALRQLPPRNRAVVVLRYLEDYSVEATAEALGATPNAVRSLSVRSLAKLREVLGSESELLLRD
ncbi:Putative RNA polymerase ECF subfamily sigma factor [Kitasatospora sp. MMS16-BH015]|uniref:SigE family RNA polymerase sigma factor n=1 Tax=Kitasatospora sp. MMS16-BH015 TaxID=2018025 RepID=UPI000CA0AD51|nr:SigE family RNA polymerase sigma factor [Kitasatospora sp. MMS16-BH015]AUG80973.1 Putative RNA polymerase ECF subfamily sigma factor [Kitasatospora sp. MMS16-BH015]